MTHWLRLTQEQVECLIDIINSDIELSGEDAIWSENLQDIETLKFYLNRATVLKTLKGLPQ